MYEIFFSSAAESYFKKLKERPLKNAYQEALTAISTDPYCGTPKHGDLAGIYSCDMKYQGVSYEIAYTIHDSNGKKIVVVLAGTRENFYEQLKKYAYNFFRFVQGGSGNAKYQIKHRPA